MLRAPGIFMESVAGHLYPGDTGTDGTGPYAHNGAGRLGWTDHVRALVLPPGQRSVATRPRLEMTPKRYPIAGMVVPFEIDAETPTVVRLLWDEVPDVDDAIAAGAEVFSDPDAAHARLLAAQDAFGEQMVLPPDTVAAIADGEPTGRVLACSPGVRRYEVLLSVAIPGRSRFGVRWRGRIPPRHHLPEWSDIPVTVAADGGIDIPWERITSLVGQATQRAEARGASLQAMLDASPRPAWTPGVPLAASAAPDVATQLAQLDDLHAAGALTDEELASERARVLDTI